MREPVTEAEMRGVLDDLEPVGAAFPDRRSSVTSRASEAPDAARGLAEVWIPHCWVSPGLPAEGGATRFIVALWNDSGDRSTMVSPPLGIIDRSPTGEMSWRPLPTAERDVVIPLHSRVFSQSPRWWQEALKSEEAGVAAQLIEQYDAVSHRRLVDLVTVRWSQAFREVLARHVPGVLGDADLSAGVEDDPARAAPLPSPDHVPSGGRGVADVERRWSCVFETKPSLGDDRTVLEVIRRARDGTDRSAPTNSGRAAAADWAKWGSAIADGAETVFVGGLEEYGTIDQQAFRHPDGSWLLATDTGRGVDVSRDVTGTEMCELVGDCVGVISSDRLLAQHRLSLRDLVLVALAADRRVSRGADRAQVAAVWPSRAAPRALSGSWTDIVAATLTMPALHDADPADGLFGFVDGALAATVRGAALAASLAPPDRWVSLRNDDRSTVIVAAGDDVWVIDSHREARSLALIRGTPAVLDAALAGWFRVGEI